MGIVLPELLGLTASEAAAFAIGVATGPALRPLVQDVENTTWEAHSSKPLNAGEAAAIVAENVELLGWGESEAKRTGINNERFDALVQEALSGPGLGELFQLLRRDDISDAEFRHGLRKAKVETRWDDALLKLRQRRLDAPVIALAIVRGIMDDPGFLPVGPPSVEGKVKAFPVSPLDTLTEAKAAGINRERLFVQTAIAGRPMGPEGAASAVFRRIIERVDYNRAVAEGDVRNEWADAIFETARQIPSASDYVQAHLRGWIDEDAMNAGTAKHGMSETDTHLLYLRAGRPAAPGQMATAAARGIDGPDGRPMDKPQFLKGIKQSDIRPEWGEMLWEARFLYPPLFQLTRLVQAGAIDADTAREWAVKDRYPPEVVTALHTYWQGLGGGATASHVGKAQTQLWGTAHRSYLTGELTDADATDALTAAGVQAGEVPQVLTLWAHEANVIRKRLTQAQIKSAFKKASVNAATGQAWTRDEAISALGALGLPPLQAQDYLNI